MMQFDVISSLATAIYLYVFGHFLLFARLPHVIVTLRTLFTYILEADGAEITAHLRLLHDCFMSKLQDAGCTCDRTSGTCVGEGKG